MVKSNSKMMKKQFLLTAVGFLFQLVGSICVIIATMNAHNMMKAKIKEVFEK